jgi:hypothetical protein
MEFIQFLIVACHISFVITDVLIAYSVLPASSDTMLLIDRDDYKYSSRLDFVIILHMSTNLVKVDYILHRMREI